MHDLLLNKSLENKSRLLGIEPVCLDESLIIKTDNLGEMMKKVSSFHSKKLPVIVLGSTDEINRKAVEDKRVAVLLSPENSRKKDFIHWKNSGLNDVLCRLAARNNVAIGISASSVASCTGKERALRLGRIMQNVKVCRKCKTKILLASFARNENELFSPYELKSFGAVLGMTPSQIDESLEVAGEIRAKTKDI